MRGCLSTFPDQLEKIIECLGTDKLNDFIEKYEIAVPEFVNKIAHYEGKQWKEYITAKTQKKFIDDDSLDLLDKLLRFDPNERLTATEAMAHCYFDKVRERNHEDADEMENDEPNMQNVDGILKAEFGFTE